MPRAELEWLGARGDVRQLEPGATLVEEGSAIDEMWILLAGRIAVRMQKGASWRTFYDLEPGRVMGAMPFSRVRIAPQRLVVEDDTIVFALSRSHFTDLVRECPGLTEALVHHMLDRARDYRTAQLHDDRIESLGRLAAGLAHELNNPASGAAGNARSLAPLLDELQIASKALARARLTDEQLDAVEAIRGMCMAAARPRSPLEMADREDEFSDWLLAHRLDPAAASTLATAMVTLAALDHLAAVLPAETLGVAITGPR